MAEYKIDQHGTKVWYNCEGRLHREDGPAFENSYGDKAWYINGLCHRDQGPAVEWHNGDKDWYINGFLHREDGPAIECTEFTYWYYHGKHIECSSQEEYLKIIKMKNFW